MTILHVLSLVPRPLPDFISQPWRKIGCEIKSGSGLGTRLTCANSKNLVLVKNLWEAGKFVQISAPTTWILVHHCILKICGVGIYSHAIVVTKYFAKITHLFLQWRACAYIYIYYSFILLGTKKMSGKPWSSHHCSFPCLPCMAQHWWFLFSS